MDDFTFDPVEFGSRLRTALELKGLSLSEAARKLEAPHSRISEYVNGHRTPPVPRLLEIVHRLELDIRVLFPAPPETLYMATMRMAKAGEQATCSIQKA